MSQYASDDDIATYTGSLKSKFGRTLKLGPLLGEGGQGRVFQVTSAQDGDLALKWYHRPSPLQQESYEEQRRALEALVNSQPPDGRFLWPQDVVYHRGGYGYLMQLRPDHYASIEDLILGRVRFARSGPYRTLCTAAMGIADCFRRLHLGGLCYKDINYGGPFFRADTGAVLICDNDNVRPNETKGIVFFPEFAAPEVNRREAHCTTRTDNHSLAVLLYYMFMRGNPLEGRREAATVVFEDNAKQRTFGTEPIFVFDPQNTSNRPLPGIHDQVIANWARIPAATKAAFTRAFTDALRDPRKRATDTEWLTVFSRLRDCLSTCHACGRESFIDPTAVKGRAEVDCSFCRKPARVPPRIVFDTTAVYLSDNSLVYSHHLGGVHDASPPIGAFMRHETRRELIGLNNLTSQSWFFTDPDGASKEIPPGKSVSAAEGRQVQFPSGTGTITFQAPS
jgi:eukaryotic-like serine/threonine-protein kinase